MSLIRHIVLLLAGVLLLALLGSVTANVVAARDSLLAQLRLKNADNAQALALALSQHDGDAAAIQLLMSAQFDTGHYQAVRLLAPDGSAPLFLRQSEARPSQAPAWFVHLLPMHAPKGVAQVTVGWRQLGTLEVESQSDYAYDALWTGARRSLEWLILVGLAAGLLAWALLAPMRRTLAAMVEQAGAVEQGRFTSVAEPRTRELRRLAQALNAMVHRLRGVFEAQAAQVELLRRHSELDALTGVANRRHFLARLQAALEGERGAAQAGLVMLRVPALEQINRRGGREQGDAVLRAVAGSLQAYEKRIAGACCGRLNGADFALFLPAAEVAADTAAALAEALKAMLQGVAPEAAVCLGSADLGAWADAGSALAAADDALARAEAEGGFARVHRADAAGQPRPHTEAQWRAALQQALAERRVALAHYPVLDRQGKLLHHECPLRLRLFDEATPAPAARWLSHALRSRLMPQLDLCALDLALAELAQDDVGRSVNIALDSLQGPGFVAAVRGRVEAAGPALARRLWLELPERALRENHEFLREAVRQWAPLGVQVGVEHAGGSLEALGRAYECGLGFVKVDRRHVEGVAADPGVRQFASGLVTLLRGMGVVVVAEGVHSPQDLAVLWSIGFDAATGPAVTPGASQG